MVTPPLQIRNLKFSTIKHEIERNKLHYKITPISPKNSPKVEFFKSSVALITKYSSEKKIENEYINTSITDIYKKYTKHFQDPTRELFDPMVEFIRWCPYLELERLKFWHIEM